MIDTVALIELVERSPALASAHDKAGWLELFADGAVVEDPVGTAPHQKGSRYRGDDDELGRFYDTFIAPNEIRFEVREDILAPPEVVRDVVIHTRLGSGLDLSVPARLLYEVTSRRGGLQIARLAAHWELRRMSVRALRSGSRGLATSVALTRRLLSFQGLRGTLAYSRGLASGIFGRGPQTAERFRAAVAARDPAGIAALFLDGNGHIELPRGELLAPEPLLATLGPETTLVFTETISSGWVTTARFTISEDGSARRGIVFFHFDRGSGRLTAVRFYVAAG